MRETLPGRTLCAVCEKRGGTRQMPDGRLFCSHCARTRSELGADWREGLSTLDAWEGYVNFKENARAAANAR